MFFKMADHGVLKLLSKSRYVQQTFIVQTLLGVILFIAMTDKKRIFSSKTYILNIPAWIVVLNAMFFKMADHGVLVKIFLVTNFTNRFIVAFFLFTL